MPFGTKDDAYQWLKGASPDDVISHGKQVLQKISTMPSEARARFIDSVRGDRNVTTLLEQLTQTAG